MTGSKVDILCSPNHPDKFIIFGQDLSLYKIDAIREGILRNPGVQISNEKYGRLLATNADNQYAKCAAWYPHTSPDHLVAVGLADGKVVLSSFGKYGTNDPHTLIGKEFLPKHTRPCNCLAWNPIENNILAEGLDKYRTDYSLLIWDVNSKGGHDHVFNERRSGSDLTSLRNVSELGPTDPTYSLSWFNNNPKTIVAGMSNKFLRIYDLRDVTRHQSIAHTKAVHSVVVDPHQEHRLASFVDNQLCVWDTRNFDKPVLTLQEKKSLLKIAWAPTRSGVIALLTKESSTIKLYDIQLTNLVPDELEPAVIERSVQPSNHNIVASFDWHTQLDNRMLTIATNGDIKEVEIFERMAVNWSAGKCLSWACGRSLVQCNSVCLMAESDEDISVKMKKRAQRGYGLEMKNLKENGQRAGDDKQLKQLWTWMDHVKGLADVEEKSKKKVAIKNVEGVKAILKGSQGSATGVDNNSQVSKSELNWQQWQTSEGQKLLEPKKMYKSICRARALQLCGWGIDRDFFTINGAIDKLQNDGEFEKAAAVALFNLKMRRAIEVLKAGSSYRKKKKVPTATLR